MPVKVSSGQSSLIIALPYAGMHIPAVIHSRLSDDGRHLIDADSILPNLLDGLLRDTTTLKTDFHRYVSDVETPEPRTVKTPARGMMGVVPLFTRTGSSVWEDPPTASEANTWRSLFYAPYHAALSTQIARVRATHGRAMLVTIKSAVPSPEKRAVDLAFSINMSASGAVRMSAHVARLARASDHFTSSLDGHLCAGWSTKHHGKPDRHVHALQISIQGQCFLKDATQHHSYDKEKAEKLRQMLHDVLDSIRKFMP